MSEPDVLLAYFGHHKCATQWTKRIVDAFCAELGRSQVVFTNPSEFDRDLPGAILDPGHTFLSYLNADRRHVKDLTSVRGFHMIRDPRDIAVSAYFSHRNSHPLFGDLESYRQQLQELPEREGLLLELERCARQFGAMQRWDYDREDILELRMEDVTTDTERSLGSIAGFLGAGASDGITPRWVRRVAEANSFRALSGGRAPGTEDPDSHLRKGVAGDWVNHFEPEHVAYTKEHYGALLLKLGYETSDDWG